MDKYIVRQNIKTKRDNISIEEKNILDDKIFNLFIHKFSNFNSYFIYNSINSEVSTKKIIDYLIKNNKKVYLPKIENKEMFQVEYSNNFEKGKFGILEPVGNKYLGNVDVCVCPLLAYNNQGYRIGYGGGYYDKFLQGKNILKIGLAYSIQNIDFDCFDNFDIKLDFLISEKEILCFNESNKW